MGKINILILSLLVSTVFIGNALAATNSTDGALTPNLEHGKQNFNSLQYADKAQWTVDTLYYIVNVAAVLAVLVLVAKLIFSGFSSVADEVRERKAVITVIIAVLILKVGLMFINVILGW